ncbi:PREDICTED: smoothelin-like protein 2 [Gavialis gangeticus]|uniref:smoothelin-like protein 2 n=1 Tax=Gavialis gangeticus TaxID=94835 RepID=UPI00092F4F84|nr:PREDICTED: smoothelin-like protein 2 [Gavialis gangeticus]
MLEMHYPVTLLLDNLVVTELVAVAVAKDFEEFGSDLVKYYISFTYAKANERYLTLIGASRCCHSFCHRAFARHSIIELLCIYVLQSLDLDDHSEPEPRKISNSTIIENGHQSSAGQAKVSHEVISSLPMSNSSPEAHAPAVSLQMPHLPVTAVTRVSEKFSGETSSSSGTANASSGLVGQSRNKNETVMKTSNQSVSAVKTWNSSSVRTVGTSVTAAEKSTSVTKSVSAMSYGMTSGTKATESVTDSYSDVTPKSHSPPPTVHRQVERRRELVRSQTLPRTLGTQSRKALFEKFEQDSGKGKGESKAKLKRSQSFGVASASSIKQILLDWCRSKTIGYKVRRPCPFLSFSFQIPHKYFLEKLY